MSNTAKFSALFLAYVTVLHTIDGPWRSWTQKRPGAAIDAWSLTHVAWGAIANRMDISFSDWMAMGALNEAVEAWIRQNRPDLLWGDPETGLNVAADLVANAAGWLVSDAL